MGTDPSGAQEFCVTDQDCQTPFYFCQTTKTGGHTCEHKDLFPMTLLEYIGAFLVIIFMFIANSGGSAVGGTITPIVMMFYGYDIKMGIAISNFVVVFSGWLRFGINYRKRHPKVGYGLLVDYNFIVIMFPTLYIGATVGVIAYTLLPSLIIAILLTVVLFIAFVYTTTKTILMFKAESREFAALKQEQSSSAKELEKEESDASGVLKSQVESNSKDEKEKEEVELSKEQDYALEF